jgi:hypothetical protein
LSTITITYAWSVPDTYDLSFSWKVVPDQTKILAPSLLTTGPQNAIRKPTLRYPNGGENILTREIEVSWSEDYPPSSDGLDIWYEIFYCENYDYATEPDWKMLASVPSGIGKFNWKVGNTVKSKNVRCAVRGVNSRGERSDLSISAASFSIRKFDPISPSVISPQSSNRYNDKIQFIFDESAVLNSFSQRAKYNIYCTSYKANLYMIPIAQNIPVGSGPIVWDTATVPASDDYVFTIYLIDDDGNKSPETQINDVAILHEEFFIIDTKPPEAYIQINDGATYAKNTNFIIKTYAFDEATGVHAMQFETGDATPVKSDAQSYGNIRFFDIGTHSDGEIIVKSTFEDYGMNRSGDGDQNILNTFKKNFEEQNTQIADMVVRKFWNVTPERTEIVQEVFYAVNDENTGTVYKNPRTYQFAVNEPVLCMVGYDENIYVSVKNTTNTAQIYRWDNTIVEEAITLTDTDSSIISMVYHKDKIYLGSANGTLYSYNRLTLSVVSNFNSGIISLYSDGNVLGIILSNNKKFYFLTENGKISEITL